MTDNDITEEQVINGIRKYARKQFRTVLDKPLAKGLEEGCFNYAVEKVLENQHISLNPEEEILDQVPFHDLKTIYKQIFIKVISNIKFNKNSDFVVQKLIEKEWKPQDIPKMHREMLYPEKWDSLYRDRTEKTKKKRQKGMHRCPRCKSWYTEYSQMQTRSSDEPMSTFVTCECGYRWRYG